MGAQEGVERVTQVRDLPTQLEGASFSCWPWVPPTAREENGGVSRACVCGAGE